MKTHSKKPLTALFLLIISVFLTLTPLPSHANSEMLATGLAENRIDITAGFHGDKIVLFGMQKQAGDIAIILEGPQKNMRVRRKENVGGIWMNRTALTFEEMPSFYSYALSNPDTEPDILKTLNIGALNQRTKNKDADKKLDAKTLKTFQDGLIRNKGKQNLYKTTPEDIEFLADGFFRTSFYIPANVSTGAFTIKTLLINDDQIMLENTQTLKVEQIGTGAKIYNFSKNYGLFYGLLCVMFAASIGWMSNAVRNRLR